MPQNDLIIVTQRSDSDHQQDLFDVHMLHIDSPAVAIVTRDSSILHGWIAEYLDSDSFIRYNRAGKKAIIGSEMEWCRESMVQNGRNRIDIIIFHVYKSCLIFQLEHNSIPHELFEFMADRRLVFIGVGLESKLRVFQNQYQLELPRQLIEDGGMKYVDLYERYLHPYAFSGPDLVELDDSWDAFFFLMAARYNILDYGKNLRSVRNSDWQNQSIRDYQVAHAFSDSYLCFILGKMLIRHDLAD